MPRKRQQANASQEKGKRSERRVSGPRPFWSGTITFGLVTLPVGLYPANRSKPVSLRMVDRNGTPLARRYFCEKEERVLSGDELVRGYPVEQDTFVVVEDEELDSLAPERSQEIDLKRFVALSEIDPLYFERAYFLTPEQGVTKAYRLLAKSMEEAERAGIATFVMRGKEYLVAIIAEKGILRAETLRFHDEIRSPADIGLPAIESAEKARVNDIEQAIERLSTDKLDHEALADHQSRRLLERAKSKLKKGENVVKAPETPDPEQEEGEVIDLMQVLKQSLAEGRSPIEGTSRRQSSGKKSRERKSSDAPELNTLSRNELYEQAQQLDIAGRSNMSKQQLIRAIANANP